LFQHDVCHCINQLVLSSRGRLQGYSAFPVRQVRAEGNLDCSLMVRFGAAAVATFYSGKGGSD